VKLHGRSLLRPDQHRHAGGDHRQAQPLPHADREAEAEDAGVRLAEKFCDEARRAVADEDQGRHHCFNMTGAGIPDMFRLRFRQENNTIAI
jgi:hypothetical protein